MTSNRIVEISNIGALPYDKQNWTAIIPAAGRGSRLGFSKPKILYPIAGKPILTWLHHSVSEICSRVIIVVSPSGRDELDSYINAEGLSNVQLVEQPEPTGMGDAVLLAEKEVHTENSLVIWGDQVLIKSSTLAICAGIHEDNADSSLTIATVLRKDPYINIVRDENQKIILVQQAREGEIFTEYGENDCGVFLFNSKQLFSNLRKSKRGVMSIGSNTGEFNLLQNLPMFEEPPSRVNTVRLNCDSESRGVNDRSDAEFAASILRARSR